MNLKKTIYFFIFFNLMVINTKVIAQTAAKKINESISKIESYLYQNPSAGKIDLLSLLEKNQTAPDSIKGYIYMNLATSFGILNQLDSGLWAANNSISLLAVKNIKRASALRTKAILYRLKGEYEPATAAIKECLQLNDSLWKNQTLKAIALQEYASLCNDQNNFYLATKLYLQALDVVNSTDYKDIKGNFNAMKIQVNLAEAYASTGNFSFAILTFQKVMPKLDSLKDYDGYVRTGYQLAESYIQNKQYKTADSLAEKLLPLSRQLKNEELESYLILKLGLSRSARFKYLEAIPYYREAFELMRKNNSAFILDCVVPYLTALKNTGGNSEALQILNNDIVLSMLKLANKDMLLNYKKIAIQFTWNQLSPFQIYEYFQDILLLSDSVKIEGQKQMALELQAKYQFEEQEKNKKLLMRENELLRKSEDYKHKQIYLILIIASLMIATIILLSLRIRQRSRIQAQELEVQKREIQLQKQQTEWAIQEKNYRDHLLEQQKIVMVQTLSDAEELKIKLKQLVEEQAHDRRKELIEQFEKAKENKMGLDKLLVQFNNIHPSFISSLYNAYPILSQSDLQFCVLYRMNISTKDIASLLHIEYRSIYTKKYRILEKMQLGKEDDFDKIIFNQG